MLLKPNSNKSLPDLFNRSFSVFSRFLNCVKIGQIQSFDKVHQTATVQIMHKEEYEYNFIERQLNEYPLLEEVPVVVLGGGGGRLTFPIKKGDTCLLLFNDYELDGWWISGESRPSDFPRKHDLSDAVALVGLNSIVSLIQNYSDFVELHYSDISSIIVGETIDINNAQTNVGGNMEVDGAIVGNTTCTSELHSTHGASGTFTNSAGKTLTIVDGIITAIS